MSTKEELAFWHQGIQMYKQGDLSQALELLRNVGPYAKILFNIGMIYSRTNDNESADIMYSQSLKQDSYFAVSYLQKGYTLFLLYDYERAEKCFQAALQLLLENDYIDYSQLGLQFKLYRCELLFNLAMCYQQMGDQSYATKFIADAQKIARTDDHRQVINQTSRHGVQELTLFTVPFSCIFEVPEQKVKNLEKKDFLKEGKVVVDTEAKAENAFLGFTGATILDPKLEGVDATTLVRKKTAKETEIDQMITTTLSRSQTQTLGRLKTAPSTSSNSSTRKKSEPTISRSNTQPLKSRKSSLPTNRYEPAARLPMPPKILESPRGESPRSSPFDRSLSPRREKASPGSDSGYDDPFPRSPKAAKPQRKEPQANQIKVKLHTEKQTLIIMTSLHISLADLETKVCGKMGCSEPPMMTFLEEEDTEQFIRILDDDDLVVAFEGAMKGVVHLYLQKDDDLLDFY